MNDILDQPFYEVYNEDTLQRCISLIIVIKKNIQTNLNKVKN